MKINLIKTLSLLLVTLLIFSCGKDDEPTEKKAVIENYAKIVLASYQTAQVDAQALESAINTFVGAPTEVNFKASKTAWLKSRESYGVTEAYRFANGPIDSGDTEDIEGWLNSWPLDEVFIDYVNGDANAGIINDLSKNITKEVLTGLNGADNSEANVSIGYHAIEFLLWGQDSQDPSNKKPGQRAYTDFVDGGTASNQSRRRDYLAVCADLITDHLQVVIDLWKDGGSYKKTFLALEANTALKNMLGIAELAGSELAVERMEVALQNQDQEDEHSCFSDNTHRDIILNFDGVINVYKGTYGSISGASIEDLITEEDEVLGKEITSLLNAAKSSVNGVAVPFDYAISNDTERVKVTAAIKALKDFSDKLVLGAAAIGITL